jgi:glutamate-ammonia-ligase adenylyltransferase
MMDIELAAQTCALIAGSPARNVERQLAAAKASGMPDSDVQALTSAYRLFWRLHAAARLLSDRVLEFDSIGEGGRSFILRETGAESEAALAGMLERAVETTVVAVDRLVGGAEEGAGNGTG